jgi:hypothetical protein
MATASPVPVLACLIAIQHHSPMRMVTHVLDLDAGLSTRHKSDTCMQTRLQDGVHKTKGIYG